MLGVRGGKKKAVLTFENGSKVAMWYIISLPNSIVWTECVPVVSLLTSSPPR